LTVTSCKLQERKMGTFKKIEDIEVWRRACRLAVEVYKITKDNDFDRDWGLRDQIRKSVVSIPSNIAEGHERDSAAEFSQFLKIAKGSCGELRTQLYIAHSLGYVEKGEMDVMVEECKEISSMISGLMRYLKGKK
jgi:four helix bundle protein